MEFPDLGAHCGNPDCEQLDFLPIKCKWCTGSFCQDHFKVDKHSCPQLEQAQAADKKAAVCPKCNEVVMVLPGEDVDAKVIAHIEANCDQKQKEQIAARRCCYKKCKVLPIQPVICIRCEKHFCLTHRQPDSHACTAPLKKPAEKRPLLYPTASPAPSTASNKSNAINNNSSNTNNNKNPKAEHPLLRKLGTVNA